VGRDANPTDRALADRAWRGYHPRAAVPAVAAAVAASAVLLAGRWALDDFSWLADQAGALAFYAMTLAVWPSLLATLVYRMVTFTYRLTDRAVLIDRGFASRPEPPVWFADLTAVEAEAGWLGRGLGVGRVVLRAAGGRVVTLTGVGDPAAFAAAVRAAAETFKAGARGTGPGTASTGGPC
jgi:uncharacterized membrane protein YdbT with pleckstrin-like domain